MSELNDTSVPDSTRMFRNVNMKLFEYINNLINYIMTICEEIIHKKMYFAQFMVTQITTNSKKGILCTEGDTLMKICTPLKCVFKSLKC